MITPEEYDKVQILLGRKGRPRPKKYEFAFRGLIRCGECGATVTPDEKNQIICPKCKYKFSSKNRLECPRCTTPIEKMERPTILHYIYYHCTKSKSPCGQRSIEIKTLERQIDELFSRIQISERFKDWAIRYLKEEDEKEVAIREKILDSKRRAYQGCLKRLNNLLQLKISPLNVNGVLLSDEEYAIQRTQLMKEKAQLEVVLNETEKRKNNWIDIAKKTFEFACYARYWFSHGTHEEKTQILQAFGSNLILKDKKLQFELKKPFTLIGEVHYRVPEVRATFEPKKSAKNELKLEKLYSKNPVLCLCSH